MEESNISNQQKNIQDIESKNIFIHIIKPEFLPVGSRFIQASLVDQLHDEYYDNISVGDLFDYMKYTEFVSLLDILKNKLTINGTISVQSVDFYQLCSSITFDDVDQELGKVVLYNNNKKTIYNLKDIEIELDNRNLIIVEKKYINIFEYFIKASKQ